jgi:DNA-directed RNA polymerase subunit RPC12/RpoP
MTETLQEDSPLVGLPNPAATTAKKHKAHTTPCECGKSMCLLNPPLFHCPKCHETYMLRQRGYPVRCGRCGYNITLWRARNGISDVTPAFA